MTPDPIPSAAFEFTLRVERFYAALMQQAALDPAGGAEPSLGGSLLYAAELDADGRALMVAGNIAGAATLAASADVATQKQAVRDGVADFLVNSLDEALRILKNEIRKREAVAVCVAAAPETVEGEMLERGVQPDLVFKGHSEAPRPAMRLAGHPQKIECAAADDGLTLMQWWVVESPAVWMPRLDAIALECLGTEARVERRWLRLAPRYLGRQARGVRAVYCEAHAAMEFSARVSQAAKSGLIGAPVRINLAGEETLLFRCEPTKAP